MIEEIIAECRRLVGVNVGDLSETNVGNVSESKISEYQRVTTFCDKVYMPISACKCRRLVGNKCRRLSRTIVSDLAVIWR